MLDAMLQIGGIAFGLLVVGMAIGLTDRAQFRPQWLIAAVVLVLINDALVTNLFGSLPILHGGNWNWQGKALATVGSLAIASLAWFGWKRIGLTLDQGGAPRGATWAVIASTTAIFAVIALVSPNESVDANTLAFQATMPGIEEELFYRGVLLLALNEAFTRRWRVAGVSVGWAALLTSILFGLAHAVDVEAGAFSFDLFPFLFTAFPALILVWVRERTGSLIWPILLHNLANLLPLVL